jgi:hypothetical protein
MLSYRYYQHCTVCKRPSQGHRKSDFINACIPWQHLWIWPCRRLVAVAWCDWGPCTVSTGSEHWTWWQIFPALECHARNRNLHISWDHGTARREVLFINMIQKNLQKKDKYFDNIHKHIIQVKFDVIYLGAMICT